MKIRYLTNRDAEELREIFLNDTEGSTFLGHSGGALLDSKHDRYNNSFVAVEGKKLLGVMVISFYSAQDRVEIGATYVVKHARRYGVATGLLKFCEKYAQQNWPVRMFVGYTLENKAMENCFEKNGYKFAGSYKKTYFYNGKYSDENCWVKKI